MQENGQKDMRTSDELATLNFLKCTKEGKYATIDASSLLYTRMNEEREDLEEVYLYGVS